MKSVGLPNLSGCWISNKKKNTIFFVKLFIQRFGGTVLFCVVTTPAVKVTQHFLGINWPRCDAYCLPPCSAINPTSQTSSWYSATLIKQRDEFTLLLTIQSVCILLHTALGANSNLVVTCGGYEIVMKEHSKNAVAIDGAPKIVVSPTG
jgi:hypothetical protein